MRQLLEATDLAHDILEAVNKHHARKSLPLKRGGIVDATIIAAASFTKSVLGERRSDPTQNGTQSSTSCTTSPSDVIKSLDTRPRARVSTRQL